VTRNYTRSYREFNNKITAFLVIHRVHLSQARFEVFTAVTMKNVVFWDIKISSYLTGDTLRLLYRDQPVYAM
jgi:hypothetical protein